MSQPSAWMPNKTSYKPFQYGIGSDIAQFLGMVISSWDREIEKFARNLDGIRIQSLRPNKTGRKVNVRAQFGDRTVSFSVFPDQGNKCDPRTYNSVLEEVSVLLLKKLKVTHEGGVKNFLQTIAYRAQELAIQRHVKVYIGPNCAITPVVSQVWPLVSRDGQFATFYQEVMSFVKKGNLRVDYDHHQAKLALGKYKELAIHALRHGARLGDMQTILNEAVVQVTLES